MRDVKRPALPLYTKDWLGDLEVRAMEADERGVYADLLMLQWQEGGIDGALISNGKVAKVCGMGQRRFARIWVKIGHKFALNSDGKWRNPRVETERIRADKFSEKQRNRANGRWSADAAAMPSAAYASVSSQILDPRSLLDPIAIQDPERECGSTSANTLPLKAGRVQQIWVAEMRAPIMSGTEEFGELQTLTRAIVAYGEQEARSDLEQYARELIGAFKSWRAAWQAEPGARCPEPTIKAFLRNLARCAETARTGKDPTQARAVVDIRRAPVPYTHLPSKKKGNPA